MGSTVVLGRSLIVVAASPLYAAAYWTGRRRLGALHARDALGPSLWIGKAAALLALDCEVFLLLVVLEEVSLVAAVDGVRVELVRVSVVIVHVWPVLWLYAVSPLAIPYLKDKVNVFKVDLNLLTVNVIMVHCRRTTVCSTGTESSANRGRIHRHRPTSCRCDIGTRPGSDTGPGCCPSSCSHHCRQHPKGAVAGRIQQL